MAQSTSVQLKMKYRDKVKVTIVPSKEDMRLSSIEQLKELIYKNFPEVAKLCEDNSAWSNFKLHVQIEDKDGDLVTIESDGDLNSMEWSSRGNFVFTIDVQKEAAIGRSKLTWHSSASTSERGETRTKLHDTRGKQQPCRHYNLRGTCKFGSDCHFAHDDDGKARKEVTNPSSSTYSQRAAAPAWLVTNYGFWLRQQYEREASDNITFLSRDQGYEVLAKIVEQKNLSGLLIVLLVKLLSREEFRLSLMREHTNKVYGLLIGSSFLLQLHSHITGQLLAAKPHDVMPYLLLIEELMSRTADGWKEVPLDGINSVILKLEEGSAKTELVTMVNRLLEHRNKLHRKATISVSDTGDHQFLGEEFRSLSIVPDKEELLQPHMSTNLPVNFVGKTYTSIGYYLETHFRLLREDCIDPLRQGIQAFRNNRLLKELRIYKQVRLVGYRCGDEGVEYVVSFRDSGRTNWEGSKRLLFGALLCLSSDGYRDSFIFGVVTGRRVVGRGTTRLTVQIRVVDKPEGAGLGKSPIERDVTYVMVESTTAYFEAYYHVLKSLQREDMENVPFTKYLLDLEQQVDPPFYLLRRENEDAFDFGPVFPLMKQDIGRSLIHVLRDWPQWPCTLDEAQLQALKHGLTKELSIIQGPPGTGKTFLGLHLVRLLLANFRPTQARAEHGASDLRVVNTRIRAGPHSMKEPYGRKGPILVICMTNHALDQFLEGILKFEQNLIRIGARSKSKVLQDRNLRKALENWRMHEERLATRRSSMFIARKEKDSLEVKIHECILKGRARYVKKHELTNIATDAQIRELFSVRLGSSTATVRSWLAGDVHPVLADPFHTERDSLQGYFDCLSLDSDPVESDNETPFRNAPLGENERGKVIMLTRDRDSEDPVAENGWQVQRKRGRNRNNELNALAEVMNRNLAMEANEVPNLPPWMHVEPEELEDAPREDNNEFQQEVQEEIVGVDPPHPQVEPEDDDNDQVGIEQFVDFPDVWRLNTEQRRTLHEYWLEELRIGYRKELQKLKEEYEKVCKTIRQIKDEITLSVLRKANVVGITTTMAAKFHDILKALNSEILIVEEAAEVLEAHILAALSPCVKHLVLIGDHLQLRPSTAVYQLGTKYKLDVSMFERLVQGGVEHVTLQEQRRMRPSFSKLVRSLYPKLKDHESVSKYESIRGVTTDLLFFDHTAEENSITVDSSKVNTTEAKLVVELTLYLIKQDCYSGENIAILTMYSGQLMEIKKLLKERAESTLSASYFERMRKLQREKSGEPEEVEPEDNGDEENEEELEDLSKLLPRVSSVDDFQGEESDIIILSLVRSNDIQTGEGEGTIGFLKTSNRICVALTRAKKGMYIFGNATLLAKRSSLWNKVVRTLRDGNALDTKLELVCQNHPDTKTVITREEDFKQVIDGGCSKPCEWQLDCGHACPRRCHPGLHDSVLCPKPCSRSYSDCIHRCSQVCHGGSDCPPCQAKVIKTFPTCGHFQEMKCCTDPGDETCRSPCPKLFGCLHRCSRVCGVPCSDKCIEPVPRDLPCGHNTHLPCHLDVLTYSCEEPCKAILEGCEHRCRGNCSKCKHGTEHIPCLQKCDRTLPCGHKCEGGCSSPCPPCKKKCQKRCFHSRCQLSCGEVCTPCMELCPWQCEHYKCELLCHEICSRPRCDLPCKKELKCGHRCIGLCGEPCPTKCRICHPTTFDTITLTTLEESEESDLFLRMQDCGHLFEVANLDTWMDSDNTELANAAVKLKECPQCKTPVWKSMRYGTVVKTTLQKLEEVKKRVYGYERTRQGQIKLDKGDHEGAYAEFVAALKQNPKLMDAHFGAGRATCAAKRYAHAAVHLSFILEKSSYGAEVRSVLKRTDILNETFGKSKVYCTPPNDELSVKAMLQLASVCTATGEFSSAEKLCDVVIKRHPGNIDAIQIKKSAESKLIALIVQTMSKDVGERGHWFQCPNGHYYTIGECGGAMEQSKCPDCKATVGGGSHTLAAGNRHANIDGSTRPAWRGG